MGKTEENMITLNDSASDIFGKVMSWPDSMITLGFEICTDLDFSGFIEEKPRDQKIKLAHEIVKIYHGEKIAQEAEENFENIFTKGGVPEDTIEVSVASGVLFSDILMVNEIVVSKSDFRRLVSEGAITNMDTGEKIINPDVTVSDGTYKIGKRRFIKIKVL
ncbi:MAG: hypothetical protein NTX96_01510 [Candidatus Zambryskibacteria bacterium]|nr:hypothetical protein [Candidatus Zambryskibacteria bacterium]